MYCSNCGASLKSEINYCSSCGHSIIGHQNPSVQNPIAKKKISFWIKIPSFLIAAVLLVWGWLYLAEAEMTETVKGQLEALSTNQISEAYFDYTSKKFQETTPLESFRSFLSMHPILTKAKSIELNVYPLENQVELLSGTLTSVDNQKIKIEYQLIEEGNKWKILNIRLIPSDLKNSEALSLNDAPLAPVSSQKDESLTAPVNSMLEALKENDFQKAYDAGSDDFHKATPLEKFKEFVDGYPILSGYKNVELNDQSTEGVNGYVKVILDPQKGDIPVEFRLIKQNGVWKIWSLRVILQNSEFQSKSIPKVFQDPEKLMETIKTGFTDYKKKKTINAKEDVLSSASFLQNVENLDNLIKEYPILASFDTLNFKQMKIEKNVGKVTIGLSDAKGSSVEFVLSLIDDNDRIKLIKIEPVEKKLSESVKDLNPKDLQDVVTGQLESIKKKDISKAYQNYTSKEFKESTSMADFDKFLSEYPAMYQYQTINLPKLTFNNNIAILSGVLTTLENQKYPIEYQLIKEGDGWKIVHIQIHSIEEQHKSNGPLTFREALIGTKIDPEGVVIDPQKVIHTDHGDIYVNLYVENGSKDIKIQITLQHSTTASKVPPVSTVLNKDGDSIISLVFSSPEKGWPKGSYELKSSASNGESQTFTFQVE